ncbi:MAG: beta-lactamase family protein [Bacteroidetes bacterium]|nr:beta-lactamase family protein [Bacteroidota bacterium]
MKNLSVVLLLWVTLITSGWSQQLEVVSAPQAGGFSAERLKVLDTRLNEWVEKGWMQGGTVLIARNGKIVYHKAVGYNDREAKLPMKKDDIFRIASQTKAITSVAIMQLFEQGKLLLDDPVSKYLPAFRKQQVLATFNEADTTYTTVPAKSEITIRQLLTHTSGLGYAQIGSKEANAIYAKANLTAGIGVVNDDLLSAMNRLGKLPLMHQPGERWTYGLNTDLLGCLVEQISGKSLDQFFKEQLFEPLGMKDTYFHLPAAKADRLVKLYREMPDGKLEKSVGNLLNGLTVTPGYPLEKSTYYSGGAGLSSTIEDYAIFLQMLLNGGIYNGKRILGRNTVDMMITNQIGDVSYSNQHKFGLGFSIITDKSQGLTPANTGTYAWGGAFATSYWVDPQEKMVYLFYRQLQGTTKGEMVEKFRAMVYQAIQD